MKNNKLLIIICMFGIVISSCSVNNTMTKVNDVKNPRVNSHSTGVFIKPIVADLDISKEKKTISYRADLNLPSSDLTDNAIRTFVETYKCDYIIDPQITRLEKKTNGTLTEIEITVTGFPATYKSIYQVDSLPKSIIEFSSINLPIARVNYSSLNNITDNSKPKRIGLEFYGGSGNTGIQLDISPKKTNSIHYFVSFLSNNFTTALETNLSISISNANYTNLYGKSSNASNFAVGAILDKNITKSLKLGIGGGLNYMNTTFDSPLSNSFTKINLYGMSTTGIRAIGVFDYSITSGLSIIATAQSNINFMRTIHQNGQNTATITSTQITNYPLVFLSGGIKFNF